MRRTSWTVSHLWVRGAPSWRHAASSRTLRRDCVPSAVTSGSWVSLNSDIQLLQNGEGAAARGEESCWEVENRDSNADTAFHDGGLCSSQSSWVMAIWMAYRAGVEEGLRGRGFREDWGFKGSRVFVSGW